MNHVYGHIKYVDRWFANHQWRPGDQYRSTKIKINRSKDPTTNGSIDLQIQRSTEPTIQRSSDLQIHPIQPSTDPPIQRSTDLLIHRSGDLQIHLSGDLEIYRSTDFTRLTALEITYNNFEILLVVFMPNISTNHAITYTNNYFKLCTPLSDVVNPPFLMIDFTLEIRVLYILA